MFSHSRKVLSPIPPLMATHGFWEKPEVVVIGEKKRPKEEGSLEHEVIFFSGCGTARESVEV